MLSQADHQTEAQARAPSDLPNWGQLNPAVCLSPSLPHRINP